MDTPKYVYICKACDIKFESFKYKKYCPGCVEAGVKTLKNPVAREFQCKGCGVDMILPHYRKYCPECKIKNIAEGKQKFYRYTAERSKKLSQEGYCRRCHSRKEEIGRSCLKCWERAREKAKEKNKEKTYVHE